MMRRGGVPVPPPCADVIRGAEPSPTAVRRGVHTGEGNLFLGPQLMCIGVRNLSQQPVFWCTLEGNLCLRPVLMCAGVWNLSSRPALMS